MATNPFSGAGLDMFGQELAGLPGPSTKDNGNPLGTLATMFAKYLGGSQNPDQYSITGAIPPIGDTSLPSLSVVPTGVSGPGIKPTSSTVGISPYAQSTGLNMFAEMPNDLQKNMTYNPITMQIWGNKNAD